MAHLSLIFIAVLVFIIHIEGKISDKRLCADPKCLTPVSIARTVLQYGSDDKRILSFPRGIEVKVFSKSAGSRPDLWGAEIRGKRGYVPKGMVQELRVLVGLQQLIHIVPTEAVGSDVDTLNVTLENSLALERNAENRKVDIKSSNEPESSFNPISSINDGAELVKHGAVASEWKGLNTPSFVSGVAADSVQKATPPPEDFKQPYEVVHGTTVYLDTDGRGLEDKPVEATTTNANIQPSVTVEQKLESDRVEEAFSGPSGNKQEEPKASITSGDGDMSHSKAPEAGKNEETADSLIEAVLNKIEGSAEGVLNYLKGSISSTGETEIKGKVETDNDELHSINEDPEDEDEDIYDENDNEDGEEDEDEEEDGDEEDSLEEIAEDLKASEDPDSLQEKSQTPHVTLAPDVKGGDFETPTKSPTLEINNDSETLQQHEALQNTQLPPFGDTQNVGINVNTNTTEPIVDTVNKSGGNSNIQSLSSQQPESLQNSEQPVVGAGAVQSADVHVNTNLTKPVENSDAVNISGEDSNLQSLSQQSELLQSTQAPVIGDVQKDNTHTNVHSTLVSDVTQASGADIDHQSDESRKSEGIEEGKSVPQNVDVSQNITNQVPENNDAKGSVNVSKADQVNSTTHDTDVPTLEKDFRDAVGGDLGETPDTDVQKLEKIENGVLASDKTNQVVVTQESQVPKVMFDGIEQASQDSSGESMHHSDNQYKDGNVSFLESNAENVADDIVEETTTQVQLEIDETPVKHLIVEEKYDEVMLIRDKTEKYEADVVTEPSVDWIDTPQPLIDEDPVTEAYPNIEGQGTEVEFNGKGDIPVQGSEVDELSHETQKSEVASSEQVEQPPRAEVPESSEGFFSGLGSSISSLWGSPEKVVEVLESSLTAEGEIDGKVEEENDARKKEERDAKWSSFWRTPTEESPANEVDEGHREQDHLISKGAPNVASCDTLSGACEVESASGVLPTEEQQQLPAALAPEQQISDNAHTGPEVTMELQKISFESLIFLVITAITVLLFTLGYYYIEKLRRDGSLVAKITSLEKALLVLSKENFLLKDDLQETKEKLSSFEDSSLDSGEAIEVIRSELEECKATKTELEEQVTSLEKELEAATEAGLELNRMLSEFLSAQHGSDTLMKSVEHLQKQLDNQQGTISTMNTSLSAKSMENENLQADLNIAKEQFLALEQDLQKVNKSLSELQNEKQEMEQDLISKTRRVETQLVEALESKSAESQRLCRELDALQESFDDTCRTLATRSAEMGVLQDCLKQTDASDGKMEELLDVGRVRAELTLATQERDEVKERLQGEEDARKLLEDHMRIVSEEVANMRTKYDEAERDKVEAQTRLEVLSNYFKEKETQLQKELGLQEAMCIQKEGDATSTYERIKSLQEEVENYKSQNETLKKEILDQERGLRAHIATLEKKVHENWVVARQAERRLEESKQESGQLRNRLTLVERNLVNSSQGGDPSKLNDRLTVDSNGELPTAPLHMGLADLQSDLSASPLHYGHPGSPPLLPPTSGQAPLPPGPFPGMPPGMFLPPRPPGIPFMPPTIPLPPRDRRPPPLGRMSSPPPEPRGGGFSPYDRSPPLSPPGRPYRSPPPHYNDSPERFRHRSPPPSNSHPFGMYAPPPPGVWDDRNGPPRSSFRPLRRDSPREPKGSNLSSGHSSESLEKSSRHSGRV